MAREITRQRKVWTGHSRQNIRMNVAEVPMEETLANPQKGQTVAPESDKEITALEIRTGAICDSIPRYIGYLETS